MRVAYLLGTYPNRSETFLVREMSALESLGVDLARFALVPEGEPAGDCRYRPGLLVALPSLLHARPAGLARVLRSIFAALPRPRVAAAWLRNLPFAAWLAVRLRAERIDLLHAAWCSLPLQIAWMCRQCGGPRYTAAGHAADLFGEPAAGDQALDEAAGIAVCNRAALAALLARRPTARAEYLPHGLPLGEWPRRAVEPSGPPLVLAVGRLVAKKGFVDLVDAVARLDPPPRLVIAGDGPLRGALAARAQAAGVPLELLGWQSSGEVREWLGRATLLALPSRREGGDRDGLANVLLEAMAVGVPVVTTTAGSAADAVSDGETGLLVAETEPAALADCIDRLLHDAPLRRRLAEAARRVVDERFDLARNAARMRDWLAARAAAEDGPDVG